MSAIGPIDFCESQIEEIYDWLNTTLEIGVDFNWYLNADERRWELFFYNNPENAVAFRLRFGV